MGTKYIDGTLNVSDLIFENGASLASKYAKDSSVVHKSGTETITGNKTFNGINTFNNNAQFKYVRIDNNWDSYGEINSKKAIQNHGIILKGTIDLHPEGDPVIFPYYMNDLAYLFEKGGSCVVKHRPEGSTTWSTLSSVDVKSLFDGTSSYTGYQTGINDTIVILIKSHQKFSFNTRVGISSGSAHWRAKNIQIDMGYMADTSNFDSIVDTLINAEADESGLTTTNVTTTKTWVTRARTTDYAYGTYFSLANGPMINGAPSWNIIRITLTNFNDTRSAADKEAGKLSSNRFAGVFALCFDSEGLNTTLLGRTGGKMYGNIVPYTHDTLQLGGSGSRFKIGYFRNILENEYLESNYITTDGFMPKNGNGVGHIGSTDVKWNQVHSQYIYGDILCENNIKLENKYLQRNYEGDGFTNSITNNTNGIWLDSGNTSFNVNKDGVSVSVGDNTFLDITNESVLINDKQIATTDDIPSYGNATTTTSGLMSASDKTTLTALTCKSESKDIALGLISLIGGQTVKPITANITDRSFFSKIIDLMRAGQVVTGFYLQSGNYYTFLKLFFANLEGGYENLSFEITDANDNSCVSYGINYDASNYIITFNKRDASIADALIDDNGTTYHYNSFALSSHIQASNTINAMTNYSKPTSTSAIKATDSLNTAIGKLEKALDGKGTSNLTLGTSATTAAKGDHTHKYAGASIEGGAATMAMSTYGGCNFTDIMYENKNALTFDGSESITVTAHNVGAVPVKMANNSTKSEIQMATNALTMNSVSLADDGTASYIKLRPSRAEFYCDEAGLNITASGTNILKLYSITAPTSSGGTTYGLGTSGQVLKSNGTNVYWANNTTYTTFTRGTTDFSPAYTLTAKDAGFIHTWWRCSSNLYASCNFGNVIAVSATNLFPMQKYSPGTNTSNQTTAYQKSVSSGSGSYSNNSSNAFQIPQRGDMVIDQYGCIGVIESDPTTVVSTYSVRLVWKSIKDWSCLEKGTQITLADGTYKNIEDVRQGESIMGWDFEKNEPCEAIALFADAAQADEKTTYLVLDNGEILSMTDGHTLYSKNLERYIPINDLREGDILMGKDGEDVEVVSIHWNVHTFGIRQFYHVVSSNNTYFANNTLNAIHPVDKYNWLQNRSSEVVPDEILTIFEQDKGEFDCFDFTIKNKEFLALTSKHQSTLKKHRNKIGDLKNYLTNTDYVAIKMFEGLEVDETILDIRKEKRKEINALEKEIEKIEKEYNNLLVQYSDLGEDMLLSDNARRSKYFKVACKNDNEHLDLFKKYYPLKDEAYILKEIEEGKANRPITEVIEEEESE